MTRKIVLGLIAVLILCTGIWGALFWVLQNPSSSSSLIESPRVSSISVNEAFKEKPTASVGRQPVEANTKKSSETDQQSDPSLGKLMELANTIYTAAENGDPEVFVKELTFFLHQPEETIRLLEYATTGNLDSRQFDGIMAIVNAALRSYNAEKNTDFYPEEFDPLMFYRRVLEVLPLLPERYSHYLLERFSYEKIYDQELIPILMNLLQYPSLKSRVLEYFASIESEKNPELANLLDQLITDSDPETQIAALQGLLAKDASSVMPLVNGFLQNYGENKELRQQILRAVLDGAPSEVALEFFSDVARKEQQFLDNYLVLMFFELGERGLEERAIEAFFNEADANLRKYLIYLIKKDIPTLEYAIRVDTHPLVRATALTSLVSQRPDEQTAQLIHQVLLETMKAPRMEEFQEEGKPVGGYLILTTVENLLDRAPQELLTTQTLQSLGQNIYQASMSEDWMPVAQQKAKELADRIFNEK